MSSIQKNKLITVLRTFSKQEMKDFEKFLTSPYFSGGRNLKPLHSLIRSYHPDFNQPGFNHESLFKKLYRGKKYQGVKSKHIIDVQLSELNNLLEKFLINDMIKHDKQTKNITDILLSFEYFRRNMIKSSLKKSTKTNENINSSAKDLFSYIEKILLNSLQSGIYTYLNKTSKNISLDKEITLYLFAFFFELAATQVNNYLNNYKAFNISANITGLFKKMINDFDVESFEKNINDDSTGTKLVTLFNYYIIKARLNDTDKNISLQTLEYYYRIFDKLSFPIRYSFFVRLFNLCKEKTQSIDFSLFGQEANKLSEFVWSNKCYSPEEKQKIPISAYEAVFDYKSIFLKEHELKKFINKYIVDVNPGDRELIENYSNSFYYFKMKDFNRTLEITSKLNPVFLSMKNKITRLKIASLYELGLYIEADYAIKSFEHNSTENKKINAESLKTIKVFCDSLKCMISLKTAGSEKQKFRLINIIKENKDSHWAAWIDEKASELLTV